MLCASDIVVFCWASQDQVAHLNLLLMWTDSVFELKINLCKSEIFLVGRVDNAEDLALELGV